MNSRMDFLVQATGSLRASSLTWGSLSAPNDEAPLPRLRPIRSHSHTRFHGPHYPGLRDEEARIRHLGCGEDPGQEGRSWSQEL